MSTDVIREKVLGPIRVESQRPKGMLVLPDEIWREIAEYLTPQGTPWDILSGWGKIRYLQIPAFGALVFPIAIEKIVGETNECT